MLRKSRTAIRRQFLCFAATPDVRAACAIRADGEKPRNGPEKQDRPARENQEENGNVADVSCFEVRGPGAAD